MSTPKKDTRHRSHNPLYNIIMFAGLSGVFIGVSYAFYHVAGGNLVIPDHFKTNVFNPDESIVHEVIKHRTGIVMYWVNRGFLLGIAAFAGIAVIGTAGQVILGKFNTRH